MKFTEPNIRRHIVKCLTTLLLWSSVLGCIFARVLHRSLIFVRLCQILYLSHKHFSSLHFIYFIFFFLQHWLPHAMLFYDLACDENKELCKQDVLQLKLRFWSIKFPLWKMLISVELDVAPCWHADPIMNHSCSQLQHALRSKVGILVFLSPNRLCMIPCIRWLCFTAQLLAQSSATLSTFCVPLVIFAVLLSACLTFSYIWHMRPHRPIHFV